MDKKVIINYQTKKDYCECCDQKLPNPKISDIKEFEFSKGNLMDCGYDWNEVVEFEEDLQDIIREHVYDTIRFFAANTYDKIIIDKGEFDKVKQFILNEIV